MLEGSTPNYPEEAIQYILANLVKEGMEGQRKAKEITNEYLKKGNEAPLTLFNELPML